MKAVIAANESHKGLSSLQPESPRATTEVLQLKLKRRGSKEALNESR